MNPTASIKSNDFSPCSIKDICNNLASNGKCLLPPNSKPLIQGKVCGNGIKEDGEECDCGDQCDKDSCCTKDCKLKNGAKCSDKNQLCCNNCQFKSKGSTCRKAINPDCDFEETCEGNTGDCPPDTHKDDGTVCAVDGVSAQCASGFCTSRDIQCKARGSKSGMTGACPDLKNSCELTCYSNSYNACVQLTGNFIDGTSCGYNGFCKDGSCAYKNIFDQLISYFQDQPYLGIALLLLILFMFIGCLRCTIPRIRTRYNRLKMRRNDSRYDQGYPLSSYPD
eukprot:NODE_33_length_36935_cov_1.609241.p18 type:complete len:280 gc:universal NODE_33_length_36935_cov_1.609241:3387-2548(-)